MDASWICVITRLYFRMFIHCCYYRRALQSAATRRSAWNQKMYTESESETLCITHKDRTARSLGGATGGI